MNYVSSKYIPSRQDHLDRRRRLREGAFKSLTQTPQEAAASLVPATEPAETDLLRQWIERQKALHPKIVMPGDREGVLTRKKVLLLVAQEWSTSVDRILVHNKDAQTLTMQAVAAYLLRVVLELSMDEVSMTLKRGANTLVNTLKRLKRYCRDNPVLQERVAKLEERARSCRHSP